MNKISKLLYISLLGVFLPFLTTGCGITTKVIEDHKEIITYKDSTILNVRDSIVYFPIEKIVDIVPSYDTLKLETSLAKSMSYVDTLTHSLKGFIENKDRAQYQYKVVELERLVERTDTLVRTETIEVPIEVITYKVPKWCWFMLILNILTIGIFIAVKKPF